MPNFATKLKKKRDKFSCLVIECSDTTRMNSVFAPSEMDQSTTAMCAGPLKGCAVRSPACGSGSAAMVGLKKQTCSINFAKCSDNQMSVAISPCATPQITAAKTHGQKKQEELTNSDAKSVDSSLEKLAVDENASQRSESKFSVVESQYDQKIDGYIEELKQRTPLIKKDPRKFNSLLDLKTMASNHPDMVSFITDPLTNRLPAKNVSTHTLGTFESVSQAQTLAQFTKPKTAPLVVKRHLDDQDSLTNNYKNHQNIQSEFNLDSPQCTSNLASFLSDVQLRHEKSMENLSTVGTIGSSTSIRKTNTFESKLLSTMVTSSTATALSTATAFTTATAATTETSANTLANTLNTATVAVPSIDVSAPSEISQEFPYGTKKSRKARLNDVSKEEHDLINKLKYDLNTGQVKPMQVRESSHLSSHMLNYRPSKLSTRNGTHSTDLTLVSSTEIFSGVFSEDESNYDHYLNMMSQDPGAYTYCQDTGKKIQVVSGNSNVTTLYSDAYRYSNQTMIELNKIQQLNGNIWSPNSLPRCRSAGTIRNLGHQQLKSNPAEQSAVGLVDGSPSHNAGTKSVHFEDSEPEEMPHGHLSRKESEFSNYDNLRINSS